MSVTAGFFLLCAGMPAVHAQAAHQSDIAALRAEIDALKALIPSQSHAMADVDYHFSNLWFAVGNENWPLAEFYLNETKSHLNWAVRIRPVRRLSAGGQLELRPMLQALENSGLASLKGSLDKRDRSAFEAAYRQTINECFACHQAAEKPYLRPRIPESASSRIIDFRPAVAPR
jgi:hypothetical protein